MAAQVKQMLNSLSSTGGSHKDITGKYREILEKVFKFKEPSLTEGLKTFIEAGKFTCSCRTFHFNMYRLPLRRKKGKFRLLFQAVTLSLILPVILSCYGCYIFNSLRKLFYFPLIMTLAS